MTRKVCQTLTIEFIKKLTKSSGF